ncbi:hypothetical protein HMPREF1548_00301 [Clostridium sp. KLE 1755]|nr:hypothetical protein HMPREF1548_00301 [Clostridium sp. KLE 1755]
MPKMIDKKRLPTKREIKKKTPSAIGNTFSQKFYNIFINCTNTDTRTPLLLQIPVPE